jgi:DIM1 family U5 snRNP protein
MKFYTVSSHRYHTTIIISLITAGIADRVKNFAVIYVCDLDQVPDFKQMYELYDPVTTMFFFRNKHMMCDFGTGNNNKLNWVLEDKQEMIDIIETIYRGAKKGRGLVVSPKGQFGSASFI